MKDAPIRYCNVSKTQLSIARYYGSMTVNGIMYIYDAATDTLTREDIVKADAKAKKEELKKSIKDLRESQYKIQFETGD